MTMRDFVHHRPTLRQNIRRRRNDTAPTATGGRIATNHLYLMWPERAKKTSAHAIRAEVSIEGSTDMWATEHSIETTAAPEAIWRLWSDVPRWPEWNADLERCELSGPFAAGSMITMTPRGEEEPIELRIAEAVP